MHVHPTSREKERGCRKKYRISSTAVGQCSQRPVREYLAREYLARKYLARKYLARKCLANECFDLA